MTRKIERFIVYQVDDKSDQYEVGREVARVRGKAAAQREVEARTVGLVFAWAVAESFERGADAAVAAFGKR